MENHVNSQEALWQRLEAESGKPSTAEAALSQLKEMLGQDSDRAWALMARAHLVRCRPAEALAAVDKIERPLSVRGRTLEMMAALEAGDRDRGRAAYLARQNLDGKPAWPRLLHLWRVRWTFPWLTVFLYLAAIASQSINIALFASLWVVVTALWGWNVVRYRYAAWFVAGAWTVTWVGFALVGYMLDRL